MWALDFTGKKMHFGQIFIGDNEKKQIGKPRTQKNADWELATLILDDVSSQFAFFGDQYNKPYWAKTIKNITNCKKSYTKR